MPIPFQRRLHLAVAQVLGQVVCVCPEMHNVGGSEDPLDVLVCIATLPVSSSAAATGRQQAHARMWPESFREKTASMVSDATAFASFTPLCSWARDTS